MRKWNNLSHASVTAMALMLAGCGGSDGGVASAPTPTPSPTPTPPSYTRIADLSGDRSFQTGGVQYTTGPGVNFTNGQAVAYGSGPTIAYTASSDSYRLSASDGTVATFDPSNVVTPPPTANAVTWNKVVGTTRDIFTLSVPQVNGVPLSYLLQGSWARIDLAVNLATVRLGFGGSPTLASDVPRSGTASYNTDFGGTLSQANTSYTLTGNSTATFSANFASNAVTTALNLNGVVSNTSGPVTAFGTFGGTGTITNNGFGGTLTGSGPSGAFSGAFFGPQALEMGYAWYLNGTAFNAAGRVVGIKQ